MDSVFESASPRMSLFAKYGQLQMWLLSRVVWYAALFYLVTLVAFAVLRLFTGISIKRIGYFNLRHIVITPKQGIEIRIGKLGLSPHRPSVARPGLFTFIVSNFEVLLDLDTIIKHEPEADASAQHARAKATGDAVDDLDGQMRSDAEVPDGATQPANADPSDAPEPETKEAREAKESDDAQGIPLVPKNSKAFKVLRWVVQTLRVFDIQMFSTAVAFTGLTSTVATSIQLRVDMRKTRNLRVSNFKGTLDNYKLGEWELPLNAKLHISDVYAAESLDDEAPWQVFDDLKFDVSGVLNLQQMRLKELGAQLHAGRFQLDVNHVLEQLDKVKEMREQKASSAGSASTSTPEPADEDAKKSNAHHAKVLSAQDRQRMVRGAMLLLRLVNRLQLSIGAFEVLKVPVLRHVPDPVFFAMAMKDFNLDLSRMNPLSSGFKLLYEEGDIAHQAILTVVSFTAGLDSGSEQEEILYIPMLTSLTRGNMFAKTLRFVEKDDQDTHNESLVRSRWSVHSPNLSIEQRQISTLLRAVLGHMAQSANKKQGHKLAGIPLNEAENQNDTIEERLRKSGKVAIPFAKVLPKLDIQIAVSDPAVRFLCNNDSKLKDAMFVSSCQRMVTSITSRHYPETDTYGAQLSFESAENQIWYRSAAVPRFDLSKSELASLSVKARTTPYLEVEIDGMNKEFHVTVLHHEIFYAVGKIQRTISKPLHAFRKKYPKPPPAPAEEDELDIEGPLEKRGPVRKIPTPIVRMSFTADNSSVSLATDRFRSQTSDTMGLMFSTGHIEVVYETGLKHMSINTSTDGRRVTVKGSKIGLYKIDKMFLDTRRRGAELVAHNTICDLPTVNSVIYTYSGYMSSVHTSISPRLMMALNINLILAYSVVRETLDLARGAHRDLDADEPLDENQDAQATQPANGGKPGGNDEAAPPKPQDLRSEVYTIEANMSRALIKIDLPSDDQVMLELCGARIVSDWLTNPNLSAKSLRMFSEHPFQRGAWCVLMSLINLKAEYNILNPEIKDKIQLNLDGFRINIPFKFKLYRIIDNGITLSKAIKTLLLQTKLHDTKLFLDPKVIKDIPNVPRVRVKSKQFIVSLEDDYFESDLTLVMLANLRASESRRDKTYKFDRRVRKMLQSALEELIADGADQKRSHHKNASSSGPEHENSAQKSRPSENGTASSNTDISSAGMKTNGDQSSGNGISQGKRADSDGHHQLNHNESHAGHNRVEHVAQVANDVRHRATHVFSEAVHGAGPSSSNGHHQSHGLSGNAATRALRKVPLAKLETLLSTGMELGTPAYDGDEVLNSAPWLEFWASPIYEEFRSLPVPLESGEPGKLTIAEARLALIKDFDRMWIDAITYSRHVQHLGAEKTRNEVVVDEMNPDTCREERIVDYSVKPLLFAVDFRKIDLVIAKTEHDSHDKLANFLHKLGKGVPRDTEYSILVPLFIDMKAQGGLNVKLKDFPLPVLNFPPLARDQDPSSNCALRIRGNLIVAEQLMHSKENIRRLYVPLKPIQKSEGNKAGPDVLEVHRTLTPIKTYTDLNFTIESKLPSRVSFCYAYKPGFHGVGEGFSGFSKPPIDPSPVLGFWDKVRLTFHARLRFDLPQSPLCLMMKAGKSPYSLLNADSGFIFAWKKNTLVEINPNDDPKKLFVFTSDRFQLLVPDYMKSDNAFLQAPPWARSFPIRPDYESIATPEKVVFNLAQQTVWKLGMVFEKGDDKARHYNGSHWLRLRNSDFRPHYDVKMSMPEYIDDVESYDAYRGFRSDYIHMAISVNTTPISVTDGMPFVSGDDKNTGPKNSCHLTPGVMQHFSAWKGQFRSDQWPPIKTGSMFPDPVRVRSNNRTFGTALSTAQYQIYLTPLDLSFFHQTGSQKGGHDRATGVKSKIDSFTFDLHTRREPPTQNGNEVQIHSQRRWRMRTYLGEVDIKNVDIRVLEAKVRARNTKAELKELQADDADDDDSDDESDTGSSSAAGSESGDRSTYGNGPDRTYGPKVFSHEDWVDHDDYTEIGERYRMRSRTPTVKVLPFLYAPRIGYVRRTDFSTDAVYVDKDSGEAVQKFGNIMAHDCRISAEKPDRVHADILRGRRSDLLTRVGDMNASIDSMGSNSTRNAAVIQRIQKLKELVAIGNMSVSVLNKEISELDESAKAEDDRTDRIKETLRRDLESYVLTENEAKAIDEQFDDPSNEGDFAGYEGRDELHDDSPEESDGVEEDDLNTFINRFILHAVHLKWNNTVRDLLVRVKVSLGARKELQYVRCRRAVQYLEELVAKSEALTHEEKTGGDLDGDMLNKRVSEKTAGGSAADESGEKRLETIFERLLQVEKGQEAQKAYSIVLMTPRIQLISEESPTNCLQLLAKSVKSQIVDASSQVGSREVDDKIERRYAVLLNQARFFAIGEEDIKQTGLETLCLEHYSGEDNFAKTPWPPWIGLEICYEARPLKSFMVLEATSFGIRYDQPNELHVAEKDEGTDTSIGAEESHAIEQVTGDGSGDTSDSNNDQQADAMDSDMKVHGKQGNKSLLANLVIDAPQFIVSLDSVQFYTLYLIIVDLLKYQDPLVKRREEAINRIYLMSDFSGEYRPSLEPIELLQKDLRRLHTLYEQLQLKLLHEKEPSKNEQVHLMRMDREIARRSLRLMVRMRAFKSGLRKNMKTEVQMLTRWSLLADSIVLRILHETGRPMLEMFLQRVHFSRFTGGQGSLNRVTMGGVYARNLMDKAVYKQVLASYDDPESKRKIPDALRVRWSMLDPVGGIPVLDNVDVLLKPLHVQLEQTITEKLIDFAFPIKQDHSGNKGKKKKKSKSHADDVSDEESVASSEMTLSGDEFEGEPESKGKAKNSLRITRLMNGNKNQKNEVDVMLDRASNYMSIRSLRIQPTKLMVSYKGKTSHSLLNLQNLVISMKLIEYENKMWTKLDVLSHIRNEVVKTLLAQSGYIMTNRLRRHKSHTAQDERDLGLDALLSQQNSNFSSQLDGVKMSVDKNSEIKNDRVITPTDVEAVKDDKMLLLQPEHRRKAIEHPDAVSARMLSEREQQHHHHHFLSHGSEKASSVLEPAISPGRNGHSNGQPGTPRSSSTFNRFDSTREQPGSPRQLRKPQKTATTGSLFGRKPKESKEDDAKEPKGDNASEVSDFSVASHKFFGKLRKSFS